jgi:preprotein translocase subunit SecD
VVELIGRTALLNFRPVQQVQGAGQLPEGATAGTTPPPIQPEGTEVTEEFTTAFNTLDCSVEANRRGGVADDPDRPLATCDADGAAKYLLSAAVVRGANISDANAVLTTDGLAEWTVLLDFDGEGTAAFADATTDLVDNPEPTNQFAIVLDGIVQSAPRVLNPITDGRAQITGDFTQETAQNLAQLLKYGGLPLAFETANVQTVSPTLGDDQLRAGLIAGAIGLLLVALYCLFYYRGLGVVVILSLLVAGGMTYGLLVLLGDTIGYTLTLAGIAGAIVAIGITADSFVVLFERIRDEVRDGRSLRVAVETGWPRARRTIVLADLVSLWAALILYILAVGNVRGFAFTLGLTTIVDIVVVFLFTKPLLTLLARTRFFGNGHPLSGMSPRQLGIPTKTEEPVAATTAQEA